METVLICFIWIVGLSGVYCYPFSQPENLFLSQWNFYTIYMLVLWQFCPSRWILKCHVRYTVTAEIGRIFCPKCGNGGTLRKVAITVGENRIVLADRRPRIRLRGTKVSISKCAIHRNYYASNCSLILLVSN